MTTSTPTAAPTLSELIAAWRAADDAADAALLAFQNCSTYANHQAFSAAVDVRNAADAAVTAEHARHAARFTGRY